MENLDWFRRDCRKPYSALRCPARSSYLPDVEDVVVAPRRKLSALRRPFEAADFLRVPYQLGHLVHPDSHSGTREAHRT
eukprot:389118-Hanusia_phi.AAC.1